MNRRRAAISLVENDALAPAWEWRHPPRRWELRGESLTLWTAAPTDYWQRTHYGFRADNGHFLFARVEGDFSLEASVAFRGVHQYDQAGLLVRFSESCWLKTSVEHEPDGPARLGVVVTNAGWSDWSTQDAELGLDLVSLRVRRADRDYEVYWSRNGSQWSQLRIARLLEDDGHPIEAGIYACSPKAAGYSATFTSVRIEQA
jgi:regulation of enolase protein 1 (concanavalin A-like superfamily)